MPDKIHHCGMICLRDGFMSSYFAAIEGDRLNMYKDIKAVEDNEVRTSRPVRGLSPLLFSGHAVSDAKLLFSYLASPFRFQDPVRSLELFEVSDFVHVERSFEFYYFPLKLSGGEALQFLTYSEEDSKEWANRLNARIRNYVEK